MNRRFLSRSLLPAAAMLAGVPCGARAQESQQGAFPPEITFAVSGGFWQDGAGKKGYYRLFSVRQPDRSAKLALQKMAVTEQGAEVVSTGEVSAISDLHLRITSIEPKSTSGAITGPGFDATVNVTDAKGEAPQTLMITIDANGALNVNRLGK